MRTPRRRHVVPAALAVLAFALALLQSPGQLSFDTKVDLHVAPARFLSSALSVWSPTGDFGHIQSGQYVGYLFPMGPFFAVGHGLGLADWVVDRLWLGTMLAIAAWGMVRLIDALRPGSGAVAQTVGGLAYMLNPYVVTFANRTSVFLLAYALVPWLLLIVHRGVRTRRRWFWPAALGLLVATAGGGVNAATLAWILLAPASLLVYEVAVCGVPRRVAGAFAWRALVTSTGASLWWIVGVLIGSAFGTNFLPFIEQPGTIWATTSASEALRGMGYWISYSGVQFAGRPLALLDSAPTLLFTRPVVVASLVVPALAVCGFVWTRRWRYGPFFMALVVIGVVIVGAGFPEGTPLRHGLNFLYYHVGVVQFLRTSYKAEPLVMVAVAALLAAAAGEAVQRAGRRRWLTGGLVGALAGLLAVAAWPLTSGHAIGLLAPHGVAPAWRAAAAGLDAQLPPNSRALVLPGQLFSFYSWGGTVDPVLPALTSRPVAERSITPYADPHATDLLWTIDGLVEQQRLFPGELLPLLSLAGVRAVVTGTDDDRLRSGSVDPWSAAVALAGQGLSAPSVTYGPRTSFSAPADSLGPPITLPEVRRYAVSSTRGLVYSEPVGDPTIVDGSAEGLAGMAALGLLPRRRAIFYAADLTRDRLRQMAAAGAQVVISDSNRRRVFVNSSPFQNEGPTIAAGDSFSVDAAVLNPFADRGTAAQTVEVLAGARYLRSPYSPGFAQFPEHRPYAAFDGSTRTAWLADPSLEPSRRWIEVGFVSTRNVPYVDLLPEDDSRGTVTAVSIAGHRFAVHRGWNHLVLGLSRVSALRIEIVGVRTPRNLPGGAGGLSEVRIPGLHITESLRTPLIAESALTGTDLRRSGLTYLFERTTGDDPLARMRGHGPWQAERVEDAADPELGFARRFAPPVTRRWTARTWVSLSPWTSDSELDRLAGYRGPVVMDSSGRYLNQGRFRASSAFDGSPASAWIGELEPGARPWIAWRVPAAVTVRTLKLTAPTFAVRVPARVSLTVDGNPSGPLTVAGDGVVRLPGARRGTRFRLTILATRVPPGAPSTVGARRAVGIADIAGSGVPPVRIAKRGAVHARCGIADLRVGGATVRLMTDGTIGALDLGQALPARQCSAPLVLAAGAHTLVAPAGVFLIDWLALRSPAPSGPARTDAFSRVVSPGRFAATSVTGVKLASRGPAWLVLGESFDRGWRASCDGRSLGAPTVIDGYANGWLVPGRCTRADFSLTPQRVAVWAYVLSALAVLVLVAVLLLRRPQAPPLGTVIPLADPPGSSLPLRRSAWIGLAAGVVLGFIFSIRSGLVIAPAVTFILWRGISARTLVLVAGALLLIAVPAIYLSAPYHNQGGFDFGYPVELIDAHWIAVAAVVLLTVVVAQTLSTVRSRTA
jgi:arabinofuranan 3-O-arabinosyltransferase